jgi:DNA polymerase III epsilon subunit-like protein
MKFLVFDTETTGLPLRFKDTPSPTNLHAWPNIVQLSYVIYDTEKKELTKLVDSIIKLLPHISIPEEAVNIHGITRTISTEKGLPISDILYPLIEDMMCVDLIVAHNLEFDKKMILAELFRCLKTDVYNSNIKRYIDYLSIGGIRQYCTMLESIQLCNIVTVSQRSKTQYLKYPTLSELYDTLFEYKPCNLHNSINDVVITLRCFYKLFHNRDICQENVVVSRMIDLLK